MSSPSPSPSHSPDRNPSLPDPPPPAAAAPPRRFRRVPPPCWSVEETLALIDAYQEKWYSLRRGNLKASHWDDVVDAVNRRCQNLPGSITKTAVQCRHKVEKLRKRYRSEKQRFLGPNPRTPSGPSWVFFRKMEALEAGPSAGSSAPRTASPPPDDSSESPSSDDDDEEGEENDGYGYHHHRGRYPTPLVPNGSGVRVKIPYAPLGGGYTARPRTPHPGSDPSDGRERKRCATKMVGLTSIGSSSMMEEMRRRVERKRKREREELAAAAAAAATTGGCRGSMGDVVAAVRMLGDGFMRMEQMKMDMTREIHNLRMEMELKHTEMILDTQRQIVDAFVTGFFGNKRPKIEPDS